MRYYLSTKVLEDGHTTDFIGIGIASADGRKRYFENADCDLSQAPDWLKQEVITWSHVLLKPCQKEDNSQYPSVLQSRDYIAESVLSFMGYENRAFMRDRPNYRLRMGSPMPEIWSYYASYDWVIFCQLFKDFQEISIPEGLPLYCRSLAQECDRLGIPELPRQDGTGKDAIADARYNMMVHEFLMRYEKAHG